MRIAKRLLLLAPLVVAAGCQSPHPYANSTQVISAADYTTPEIILTNSGPPFVASESAVIITPDEVYAPNPTADSPNAKAPTQSLQPDSVLVSSVRQALNTDPTLAPVVAHIHIDSKNGSVSLVGSVPDDETKEKIEAEVKQIPGVLSLDDQLQPGTGKPPVIESPVENAPPPPPAGAPATVATVPTGESNPPLTPTASQAGTSRVYAGNPAQQSASAASSVQSSNFFNVRVQGPVGADNAMAQRLVQTLQRDTVLVPVQQTVEIEVTDGKATLTGIVQTEDQKQRIQAAVQQVTGIPNVDNRLRISAPSSPAR